MNGQENFRQLPDKVCLLLRREHQVAVALFLRGKRGENPASHTEVGCPHVRALLYSFEAQSNLAEICHFHSDHSDPSSSIPRRYNPCDFIGLLT
jgi:hypothetical protein